MKIDEVLDKRLVFYDIFFEDKKSIIEFLAERLEQYSYINDKKEFVEAVYERESIGETGIGGGIAIPHGKSSTVLKPGVAIIKLKNKVNWESLDGCPVNFVCIFAISNENGSDMTHLKMLASLSAKLGNDQILKEIMSSRNKNELINNLGRQL